MKPLRIAPVEKRPVLLLAVALVGSLLTLEGCHPRIPESSVCQSPPDGAMLCVYQVRGGLGGRYTAVGLTIDGKSIGYLDQDRWVELTVAPGQHEVSIWWRSRTASVELSLKQGEVAALSAHLNWWVGLTLRHETLYDARTDIAADCEPAMPPRLDLRRNRSPPAAESDDGQGPIEPQYDGPHPKLHRCDAGDAAACVELAFGNEKLGQNEDAAQLYRKACLLKDVSGCVHAYGLFKAAGDSAAAEEMRAAACELGRCP